MSDAGTNAPRGFSYADQRKLLDELRAAADAAFAQRDPQLFANEWHAWSHSLEILGDEALVARLQDVARDAEQHPERLGDVGALVGDEDELLEGVEAEADALEAQDLDALCLCLHPKGEHDTFGECRHYGSPGMDVYGWPHCAARFVSLTVSKPEVERWELSGGLIFWNYAWDHLSKTVQLQFQLQLDNLATPEAAKDLRNALRDVAQAEARRERAWIRRNEARRRATRM